MEPYHDNIEALVIQTDALPEGNYSRNFSWISILFSIFIFLLVIFVFYLWVITCVKMTDAMGVKGSALKFFVFIFLLFLPAGLGACICCLYEKFIKNRALSNLE